MSYADQIKTEPNAKVMRGLIAEGINENKNIAQVAINIATTKGTEAINAAIEAKANVEANNNRINNIIANNGNGAKDTEVVDLRVDKEGVVHPTAGAYVRAIEINTFKAQTILDFAQTSNYFAENIHQFTRVELCPKATCYYPNDIAFPEVRLDKNGTLYFKGSIRTSSDIDKTGGWINLFSLPSSFKYFNLEEESVKAGICMGEDIRGISKPTTFYLRPTGQVSVVCNGTDENYINFVNLNGLTIQTTHYDSSIVQKHIEDKIDVLLERSKTCEVTFPFVTDMHLDIYDSRKYFQIDVLNMIDSQIDFDFILSGGDNIVEPFTIKPNSNKSQAILAHKQYMAKFPKDKFLWAKGNHDDNASQGLPNNSIYVVRPTDLLPIIRNNKIIYGNDNCYYGYYDDEKSKIRVVIIDCFETDYSQANTNCPRILSIDQLKFLCGKALNFDNKTNKKEWHTMFVSHIPPITVADGVLEGEDSLHYTLGAVYNIMQGFKNGTPCDLGYGTTYRFDLQGAMPIIGYFYGHYHLDQNQVKGGINFISSSCMYNVGYKSPIRIKGTVSEMCVDLVSVDKTNKKIYLDRLGAGVSRVITY